MLKITIYTGYKRFYRNKIKKRPATKKEVHKLQNKFLNADELKSCLHQLKK